MPSFVGSVSFLRRIGQRLVRIGDRLLELLVVRLESDDCGGAFQFGLRDIDDELSVRRFTLCLAGSECEFVGIRGSRNRVLRDVGGDASLHRFEPHLRGRSDSLGKTQLHASGVRCADIKWTDHDFHCRYRFCRRLLQFSLGLLDLSVRRVEQLLLNVRLQRRVVRFGRERNRLDLIRDVAEQSQHSRSQRLVFIGIAVVSFAEEVRRDGEVRIEHAREAVLRRVSFGGDAIESDLMRLEDRSQPVVLLL